MNESSRKFDLLKDACALRDRIGSVLHQYHQGTRIFHGDVIRNSGASAVLFLLGSQCECLSEPCLILNKRSAMVRQPGDLCCPGGSISPRLDAVLSRLLFLPGSALARWPYKGQWRKQRRQELLVMAHMLAAALRESYEEMRLNPLKVIFLGALPLQKLEMFQRHIYPMACWLPLPKRFKLNWEVERLIYIPLRELLQPSNYVRYRLQSKHPMPTWENKTQKDFPCFLFKHRNGSEMLWGATFRISMAFLELVFGFTPPNLESLPVVRGRLTENYLARGK
ncbi:MAG: CoA pyrophosphatase [Deltaproteobacteria bacterium]|nr:CoA pyrophosphatase [Deltaproteobacteria bacterium]MBW1961546.1 CoA pyrophosphatase [Deltaproteobacteria bacterium]MBW2152230.1 CoA pyrophosphatase [Deltaproteobacteria bacterium]